MTKISSFFHHTFTESCSFSIRGEDTSNTVMPSPNLSRISSSLIIAIFMIGCILFMSKQAGGYPQGHRQNQ